MTLAPGSVLAHAYRVVRRIGTGAMATVYEAVVTATGERVALKIPHEHYRHDHGAVRRFVREARATLAIRSPHVVRTMALGRVPGGMPFLAMEYVDGHGLRDLLYSTAQGPVPLDAAVLVLDQIAAALSAAHDVGVIHRDLKPDNVLVTFPPSGPVAKVFDFGLSLLTGEKAGRLTLTGMTFGTPQYMAPEQIRSTKHVDARVDIYSLGVIGYEMLTLRRPFEGASPTEVWHKATHERPVPLGVHRPGLPPALASTIMKAMASAPGDRFATAGEVRAELAPFLRAAR